MKILVIIGSLRKKNTFNTVKKIEEYQKNYSDFKYEYFIYDASIGSGVFHQFPKWVKDMSEKIIVAGGLNVKNVCSVMQDIKPFGVDVSSGVEKDGVKDFNMMKEFIDAVNSCF